VSAALEAQLGPLRPVAGGSICDAYRSADGTTFVKSLRDAPDGLFAAEAAGLRWLADAGALRVPEVVGVGPDWIALEWIECAPDEEALGRGLASLHAAGAPAHGARTVPARRGGNCRARCLGVRRVGSILSARRPRSRNASHNVSRPARRGCIRLPCDCATDRRRP